MKKLLFILCSLGVASSVWAAPLYRTVFCDSQFQDGKVISSSGYYVDPTNGKSYTTTDCDTALEKVTNSGYYFQNATGAGNGIVIYLFLLHN
jgi:hypothetical protein